MEKKGERERVFFFFFFTRFKLFHSRNIQSGQNVIYRCTMWKRWKTGKNTKGLTARVMVTMAILSKTSLSSQHEYFSHVNKHACCKDNNKNKIVQRTK